MQQTQIVSAGLREGQKPHNQMFTGSEGGECTEQPPISHTPVSPSRQALHTFDTACTHFGMFQVV